MNHPEEFPLPFRLGDWLISPDLNRVTGPDGEVQLEPRVMQVLLHLAESPGRVLSRNQLLDLVWGDAIVGEENLTRAISELRRVFGDKARQPHYVETIRNHGYRLIATVQPVGVEDAPESRVPAEELEPEPPPVTAETPDDTDLPDATVGPTPPEQLEPPEVPASPPPDPKPEPVATPAPPPPPPARSRAALGWLVVPVLVLIAAGFWILKPWLIDLFDGDDRSARSAPQVLRAVPLTSYPGREWQPALSPDGTRVAFVWAGREGDNADIFIKQRDNETPLRLTDDPGWAAWPAWSPDGQTVAFVQGDGPGSTICTVPSIGGSIRSLYATDAWIEGLDWSPAGDRLVFSARPADENNRPAGHRLHFLDLNTLQVELFSADLQGTADFHPRFRPDGRALAWICLEQNGAYSLCVADVSGSPVSRRVSGLAALQGLAWSADGADLVYAASTTGFFNLWRISIRSGDPVWLPSRGEYAWNPTIARRTGQLVYEQVQFDQNIRRIEIRGENPWQLETSDFINSTRWDFDAAFSPDGERVVFVSTRSGHPELWLSDRAGDNLQRLTTLQADMIGNPRWSPDGGAIGFNAMQDGKMVVMVVGAAGGRPENLTRPGQSEVFADWTHDPNYLILATEHESDARVQGYGGNTWNLVDRRVDGGGDPLRGSLTREGGLIGRQTTDGRFLYFTRPDRPGLWRSERIGDSWQDAEQILDDLVLADRHNWCLLDGRIAYVARNAGTAYLMFHDLGLGWSEPIIDLPGLTGSGLAISPDQTTILYSHTGETTGDLMLLEDF